MRYVNTLNLNGSHVLIKEAQYSPNVYYVLKGTLSAIKVYKDQREENLLSSKKIAIKERIIVNFDAGKTIGEESGFNEVSGASPFTIKVTSESCELLEIPKRIIKANVVNYEEFEFIEKLSNRKREFIQSIVPFYDKIEFNQRDNLRTMIYTKLYPAKKDKEKLEPIKKIKLFDMLKRKCKRLNYERTTSRSSKESSCSHMKEESIQFRFYSPNKKPRKRLIGTSRPSSTRKTVPNEALIDSMMFSLREFKKLEIRHTPKGKPAPVSSGLFSSRKVALLFKPREQCEEQR